jgi:hypothetical protein
MLAVDLQSGKPPLRESPNVRAHAAAFTILSCQSGAARSYAAVSFCSLASTNSTTSASFSRSGSRAHECWPRRMYPRSRRTEARAFSRAAIRSRTGRWALNSLSSGNMGPTAIISNLQAAGSIPALRRLRARVFPLACGRQSRCCPMREKGEDAWAEELSPVRPT